MKDDEPEASITPQLLLQAYASGIFPMADSAESDEIYWVDPRRRGIMPLDGFHLSRSLSRTLRRRDHQIAVNRAFDKVVACCADRDETWINEEIFDLYMSLHDMGHAHSVEVYEKDRLVGGIYGVTLGAAYFGESMFHRATDGSKIAFAYLVHRLNKAGFVLFDTQFITPHLQSLGAQEIGRHSYQDLLAAALRRDAGFVAPVTPTAEELIAYFRAGQQAPAR